MRNKKLARLGGSPCHHKRVIRLDSRLHINPLACPVRSTWSRWNNGENVARGLLEHQGQLFCSLKCSLLKSNSWFGCWESDPSTWERFSSYKQALVIHFVNGEINAEDKWCDNSYSTADGLWEEWQYAWFVITIAGCRQSWHASAELAVLCIDKHDEHLESLHSDCMASICFSMKTIISSAQPKLSGLLDAPWMTFYKQMINSVYMQAS